MPDEVIPEKFARLELSDRLNQRRCRLFAKKYCRRGTRRVIAAVNRDHCLRDAPFPVANHWRSAAIRFQRNQSVLEIRRENNCASSAILGYQSRIIDVSHKYDIALGHGA